ncbi:MAG: response regulator transcription factor [Anaerolineales bacterium]|nr:response regulator transcription factor [Anaerolineales bacterium]MCX7609245.1 response regulator transcription factor [Anaerolineales bacterium]MDW8227873.1 response regulator transcription factor [Anaerolineales bacterium]
MKAKLLLVDDDPTLRELLGKYLREHQFEVIEAPSGRDGLRLAYHHRPDLILLDVMLPSMDGWEVCSRLREMTDVPIIMLTAKAAEDDKLRGFRLGVDDYVTKPFSFAELVARIQAVLNRRRAQSDDSEILVHGDIVLNLKTFQATLNGEPLDLTPTEFRLLEALMRRKGGVVSDETLMREVWGSDYNDPSLVRRYILLLRKKIERRPSDPVWIRTVRGFGYRLGPVSLPNRDAASTEQNLES